MQQNMCWVVHYLFVIPGLILIAQYETKIYLRCGLNGCPIRGDTLGE